MSTKKVKDYCYAIGRKLGLGEEELDMFLERHTYKNFKGASYKTAIEVMEYLQKCEKKMTKKQLREEIIQEKKKRGIYQMSLFEGEKK